MAEDPVSEQSEDVDQGDADQEARFADLFDLRRVIGGLLSLYGIILLILGLNQSHAAIQKSAGTNVDLWSGAGMLILGALFIAWALWRPLGRQLAQARSEQPTDGADAD